MAGVFFSDCRMETHHEDEGMNKFRWIFVLLATTAFGCATVHSATFLDRLTPERMRELGLDRLTPEQLEKLGVEIENYRQDQAVTAATTAVEEYRKKEEPGVVRRALDLFQSKQREESRERITAILVGPFTGWDGKTLFNLDNGQVWRQSRSDTYITKTQSNVPVVVYKAPSGYWRLRVLDDEGAWVTVVRIK